MEEAALYKRVLIPVLLLCLAYEWLVSGFDKLISGIFVQQLKGQLLSSLSDMQYQFYGHVVKNVIAPHAAVFAVLVEVGELCAGVGFVILAVALFRDRITTAIIHLGIWTSIVASFMALNFFLWQGGSVSLNPGDPFDEGITIDFMLVLIQVCIAVFLICVRRRYARVHRRSYGIRTF